MSARRNANFVQRHLHSNKGLHHHARLGVIDRVLPYFGPADALAKLRQGQCVIRAECQRDGNAVIARGADVEIHGGVA